MKRSLILIVVAMYSFQPVMAQEEDTNIRDNEQSIRVAERGTFQIETNTLKAYQNELSVEFLIAVEDARKEDTDVSITIDGRHVVIMSQQKLDSGVRWSTYKLVQS